MEAFTSVSAISMFKGHCKTDICFARHQIVPLWVSRRLKPGVVFLVAQQRNVPVLTLPLNPDIYLHLHYNTTPHPMQISLYWVQEFKYAYHVYLWFLSKGQWTYGPTYCLSIDTHIRSKRYKVVDFWVFFMKNSPKAVQTWVWLC